MKRRRISWTFDCGAVIIRCLRLIGAMIDAEFINCSGTVAPGRCEMDKFIQLTSCRPRRVVACVQVITYGDALKYARHIAAGVDHLHRNRLLHLDLKPANVMVRNRESLEVREKGGHYAPLELAGTLPGVSRSIRRAKDPCGCRLLTREIAIFRRLHEHGFRGAMAQKVVRQNMHRPVHMRVSRLARSQSFWKSTFISWL